MKSLISLIFIGAVVGLAIMVGRGTPATPPADQLSSVTPAANDQQMAVPTAGQTLNGQGGGGPQGRLFILERSGQVTEIFTLNVVTREKKTIVSDKGQAAKIKFAYNVTANGDSIVVLLANDIDPAGQLVAYKTDGSGQKTVLAERFVSTQPPVLSPDQSKLAIISFSNAEPNFGFTLLIMNVDGSGKRELAKDSSGLDQLAFSPDGQRIAFLKGATAKTGEIASVNAAGGQAQTLYKAKNMIIEDFGWSHSGLIAATLAPNDRQQAERNEVYLIDPKNQRELAITRNNLTERSPRLSPSASAVAYLQGKDQNDRLEKGGAVIVALPDGSQAVTIGSGSDILGWVE